MGWIYSKWGENLALIFQLFLLTRITSQFEISRVVIWNPELIQSEPSPESWCFLFKRKKRGGGKGSMNVHSHAPSWAIPWGYLWSIVQKAAEIHSKPLPSTHIMWCWADSWVGIPYGFSLYAVKMIWLHIYYITANAVSCGGYLWGPTHPAWPGWVLGHGALGGCWPLREGVWVTAPGVPRVHMCHDLNTFAALLRAVAVSFPSFMGLQVNE